MNSEIENQFEGNFEGKFEGTFTVSENTDTPAKDPGNSNPDEWTMPMSDQELSEVHDLLGIEGDK